MYPFRHPPIKPISTSHTISVALRHNTRLKREKVEFIRETEEALERVKKNYESMKCRLLTPDENEEYDYLAGKIATYEWTLHRLKYPTNA